MKLNLELTIKIHYNATNDTNEAEFVFSGENTPSELLTAIRKAEKAVKKMIEIYIVDVEGGSVTEKEFDALMRKPVRFLKTKN